MTEGRRTSLLERSAVLRGAGENMSRIAIPSSIEAAPVAARPLLEAVQKKLGGAPNMFRAIANSPAALEGYLALDSALSRSSLDARTRQRIALAVAERNGCDYCLSAHAFIGKNVGLSDAQIHAARHAQAEDPTASAAVSLAAEVVDTRGQVSAETLQRARAAGLGDREVIDVVALVALNTLTNFVNGVVQTEVDFPRLSAHAAYDGLCAVAVSMGERVPADAVSKSYHGGRLYRFSSADAKAMFDADPTSFVAKADARWSGGLGR